MRFDLDKMFGIHQQGLLIRSKRAELIAGNLANADTPNYKARDIDFKQALQQTQNAHVDHGLKTTHRRHISTGVSIGNLSAQLQYRNPMQPAVDGNTVDAQREKAAYAQNSIEYLASLRFLSGKIKTIKSALKGE